MRWLTSVPAAACTAVSEIGSETTTPRGTYTKVPPRSPASFKATNGSSAAPIRDANAEAGASSSEPTITPSGSDGGVSRSHSGATPPDTTGATRS